MSGFLDLLAREKMLQPHHMRAAEWFAALPVDAPAQKAIAEQCTCIAQWTPALNLKPVALLQKVCIQGLPIEKSEVMVGCLREALNACDKAMRHERFRG
jgi:hypothetical protein